MSDNPLPPPPGRASAPVDAEAATLTLEKVLGSPSWAEDQLHGSLMLRALRWLELLEADDNAPPQPGKRAISLDTQVDMFKVIAEWLKTSKKTKGTSEEEDGAPGIEQMREVVRQELERIEEEDVAPRYPRNGQKAREDELGDEETFEEAVQAADEKRAARRAQNNGYKREARAKKPNNANMSADSNELDIMLNRARKAAYEED